MTIWIDGNKVEIPGVGITMEQVNEAIDAAITGAIKEVYYGTGSETSV